MSMSENTSLYTWVNKEGITPGGVVSTLKNTLKSCRQRIDDAVKSKEPTWSGIVGLLEKTQEDISALWAYPSHMNSVMNSEAWQNSYNESIGLLSEYCSSLSHHKDLYQVIVDLKTSSESKKWTQEQTRVVELNLRDFHLSGIHLPKEKQKTLAKWSKESSKLSSQFSENVLKSTQAWSFVIEDESLLKGIPERQKQQFKSTAESKNLKGWLLTLDAPSFMGVMQFANDRSLREKIYRAYVTRASEFSDSQYDNGSVMVDILNLRKSKAQLLGFDHYAGYSLATKMANSTTEVIDLIDELVSKTRPQAILEFQKLSEFAKKEGQKSALKPWDVAYWSEKLRQRDYQLDSEALRVYFPLPKVLKGICEIIERLYGVTLTLQPEAKVWHETVQCWGIQNSDSSLVGEVYLDLYARSNKRDGAWMNGCRDRSNLEGYVQYPIAFVVANFMPPGEEGVALLSHQEVVTLFHELGHALHHLLTKVGIPSIAGTNNVAWDVVELPSQFFEHWAWQDESLSMISSHVSTNKPLPKELKESLLKAKNFQSGMAMMRQLEFALFDFKLHQQDHYSVQSVQALLDDIRQQTSVMPAVSENRFQNGFSHIFAGGYAAGYYSYKWAEVLSSDAFEMFEKEGIFNQNCSQKFKNCILEKGGSFEASALYKQFRGKEADVGPLLKHSGIEVVRD
jgi:oligopeptidase A